MKSKHNFFFLIPSSYYHLLTTTASCLHVRLLLQEAPEPLYFSLNHEPRAVNFWNGIIELPHGTHSTGSQGSFLFFQTSKTPFFFCQIDKLSDKQVVRRPAEEKTGNFYRPSSPLLTSTSNWTCIENWKLFIHVNSNIGSI